MNRKFIKCNFETPKNLTYKSKIKGESAVKQLFRVLVIFLLLFSFGCNIFGANDYQAQIKTNGQIHTFLKGEVNRAYRIPVLKLKGTYYEMGLQYGVLLKSEVIEIAKKFDVLINSVKDRIPWYLKPFTGMLLNWHIGQLEHRLPQKYKDELKGIAAGSGVPYSTLVFFTFGGGSLEPGCTLLFADLKNRIIHGRNFDFDLLFLGEYPVITEYNHEGEQSYVNFGVVAYPGFFNGVNKNGISITLNYGMGTYHKNQKGLPMGLKIREMLAKSTNITEAEKVLQQYETDESGWILAMASAKEKRAAIFDVFDNTIKKREMSNEQNLYAVNRIFSPLRYGPNQEARKYLKMSVYGNQSNVTRSMAVEKRLSGKGVRSIDEMLDLFTSVEFWGNQIPYGTGSIAVNYEKTLNTIIMDLQNDTVYFASEGGFSAWGTIHQVNINDMSIKVYRNELPQRRAKPVKDLLDWVDKYQTLSFQRNYQKVFEITNLTDELTPRQLYYLYKSYQKEPQEAWGLKIIKLADKLLIKYPDFGFLYKVKGEILYHKGNYQKAVYNLEKAYNSKINYESEQLEVLINLIKINQQLKNKVKGEYFIGQYCALYDKLAKVSVPDEKFREKYEEYQH